MTPRDDLVRSWGLTGTLVSPPEGSAPPRAVLVLGGSEGGHHERDAQALAQHGFTVLALAYFGAPGVPPVLKDIPLEYFFTAIDLLTALGHPAGAIGILGGSRGGEAALAIAAHDARIGAVVSVVGSGVVTQGLDFRAGRLDRILSTPVPAWTLNSLPLPYLPHQAPPDLVEQMAQDQPLRLASMFAPLPEESTALDAISIAVERIRGSVLLISAEDDGIWPSSTFSAVAANRLDRAHHPYPWRHEVMPGAGHQLAGVPGAPLTSTTGPGPGVTFEYGGDPVRTTTARTAAWTQSVAFLNDHLPAPSRD